MKGFVERQQSGDWISYTDWISWIYHPCQTPLGTETVPTEQALVCIGICRQEPKAQQGASSSTPPQRTAENQSGLGELLHVSDLMPCDILVPL